MLYSQFDQDRGEDRAGLSLKSDFFNQNRFSEVRLGGKGFLTYTVLQC